MRITHLRLLVSLALGVIVLGTDGPVLAQATSSSTSTPKDGQLGAIVKSLTGDVLSLIHI